MRCLHGAIGAAHRTERPSENSRQPPILRDPPPIIHFRGKKRASTQGAGPIPALRGPQPGAAGRPHHLHAVGSHGGASPALEPVGGGCQMLSSEQCAPGGCPQRAGTRRPDAPPLPHMHSAQSWGRARSGGLGPRTHCGEAACCPQSDCGGGGAKLPESPLGQCSPHARPHVRPSVPPLPAPAITRVSTRRSLPGERLQALGQR